MSYKVGISDIAVYVPRLFLSMETLAEDRASKLRESGKEVTVQDVLGKFKFGLGCGYMAVPDSNEDACSMAGNAGKYILERNNLTLEDIDMIAVATETKIDDAKPDGTYVFGMWGRGRTKNYQIDVLSDSKFACIGGVDALFNVIRAIKEDDNGIERGLVICTDEAKYARHSSAEPTGGGAAIGMLIEKNPRIIEIRPQVGVCTKDETDFGKPDGSEYPVVKGQRSTKCYLDLSKEALADFERKVKDLPEFSKFETPTDAIKIMSAHTPYKKMVDTGVGRWVLHSHRGLPRMEFIIKDIGPEPVQKDFETYEAFVIKRDGYLKEIRKTQEFKRIYNDTFEPSLRLAPQIGNIYTGSVFLGFVSGLLYNKRLNAGDVAAFNGYGSGAKDKVFYGILQPGFEDVVKTFDIEQRLASRRQLTIEEFNSLRKKEISIDKSILPPLETEIVWEGYEESIENEGGEEGKKGFRRYSTPVWRN